MRHGCIAADFGAAAWRALAAAILVLAAACVSAQGTPVAVPALQARVTDLTGTLAAGEVQGLEAELAALERSKGAQLAVLIVPTTQPGDIAVNAQQGLAEAFYTMAVALNGEADNSFTLIHARAAAWIRPDHI